MDSEVVVWIAVILFFFVSRLIKAQKKQRGPAPKKGRPPQVPGQSQQPSVELNDALREIRRALGYPDAAESAPQSDAGLPAAAELEPETKSTAPSLQRSRLTPKRESPALRPKRPVLSATSRAISAMEKTDTSFAGEEMFQKSGISPHVPGHLRRGSERAFSPTTSAVAKRLASRENLRQEFLIQEILAPPLVLRRRRR